jgi:ParB-like chromosome segregation protein Spo0J
MEYEQKIVSIYDIEESPLNANVMDEKTFNRLVKNLKKDKILTSAVLLMRQREKNKMMCISGHHRIRAAKKAGINSVPAIIIDEIPESKRLALQISHNDIRGNDDKAILSQMIMAIDKIDMDMIGEYEIIDSSEDYEIDYSIKPYRYVNVCLMPETADVLEAIIGDMAKDEAINYLTTAENYDILKGVLTKAFGEGFKTAGKAFRKMLDVYLSGGANGTINAKKEN